MMKFVLHPQLEQDTLTIADLGLNRVLLMNDRRFTWLILVPKRPHLTELHDLSPLDQAMMTFEITSTSQLLQQATGCDKINVAALGNQVPQLHVHIIARTRDDAAWPNPVWGSGPAAPYRGNEAETLIANLAAAL